MTPDQVWIYVFCGLLFLSSVLGMLRIYSGPHLLDRVLALDYLSIVGVASAGVASLYFGDDKFLDVGLMFALVGFLTALLFSRHVQRRKWK